MNKQANGIVFLEILIIIAILVVCMAIVVKVFDLMRPQATKTIIGLVVEKQISVYRTPTLFSHVDANFKAVGLLAISDTNGKDRFIVVVDNQTYFQCEIGKKYNFKICESANQIGNTGKLIKVERD